MGLACASAGCRGAFLEAYAIPPTPKNGPSMVPKWSNIGPNWVQIGSKIDWDGLWIQVGCADRFQGPFPQQNAGHLGPKIGPNSIQNRFWSDLKIDFKTNAFSRPILERFLVDFEAFGSTFLIDFRSSSMQRCHYLGSIRICPKCLKTKGFLYISGYDG